jgi:hypothetical protein
MNHVENFEKSFSEQYDKIEKELIEKYARVPDYWTYLNRTILAESEEDLDYLFMILKPSDDREEMAAVYETVLGYNPMDYHDRLYLNRAFDHIISTAPIDVKEILEENKEDIIEAVIIQRNAENENHLAAICQSVIMNETGWSPEDTALDLEMIEFDDPYEDDEIDDIDDDDDSYDDEEDEEDF